MIDPQQYLIAIVTLFSLSLPVAAVYLLVRAYRKRRAARAQYVEPSTGNWTVGDVGQHAVKVLGTGAHFAEIAVKDQPTKVYGVVSAPGRHRIVSIYQRYTPHAGRRRIVDRLNDPIFVASTRKAG